MSCSKVWKETREIGAFNAESSSLQKKEMRNFMINCPKNSLHVKADKINN